MERVPQAHRQQRAADAGMAAAELAVFPCSLKGGAVRLGKNTPEPAEERRAGSSSTWERLLRSLEPHVHRVKMSNEADCRSLWGFVLRFRTVNLGGIAEENKSLSSHGFHGTEGFFCFFALLVFRFFVSLVSADRFPFAFFAPFTLKIGFTPFFVIFTIFVMTLRQ